LLGTGGNLMLGGRTNRREFIAGLGGAAAWPMVARTQQSAIPVVGYLDGRSSELNLRGVALLRRGLKQAGYVEGENVAFEYRWAENHFDRLPELATDLVSRHVAVIVASGGSAAATLAAKAATATIPIVFVFGADPVKTGVVASLNRPGGNVTGVTFQSTELGGKRLELLHEMVPQETTIAHLTGQLGSDETSDILASARLLGLHVIVLECRSDGDLEAAFKTLIERRAGALIVGAFPFLIENRHKILAMAALNKIPAMYPTLGFAVDGGLMSYSADERGSLFLAGFYVGRILKGMKPADLPVQQPRKFVFVINLKTATALDLTLPPGLLAIADEVIE
jgi:putative ABC transport system substrate-binding protein